MSELVHDPRHCRLGKKRGIVDDPRTLKLAEYADTKSLLPQAPKTSDVASHVTSYPLFGNDHYGDCTLASQAHRITGQRISAQTAHEHPQITTDEVLAAYSQLTGFDPRTGANDNGAYLLDVLNLLRTRPLGGDQVGAFVKVDISKKREVRVACWLFEGLYIGLDLPESAQYQVKWDVPKGGATGSGEPGSWGGHATWLKKQSAGTLDLVTWGEIKPLTWAFLDSYCSEAYALVSPAQLRDSGKTPQGFDNGALLADLEAIT